MFTGLITDIGTIDRVLHTDAGREFRVRSSYENVSDGESVALNGACLTVREHGPGWFSVAAVVTTLERTAIGRWGVGQRINLERALALGERFGGHLVLGHVDGCARVDCITRRDDAQLVDLAAAPELMPLMVAHGSVAVDGVSLTVNAIDDERQVQIALIEYTLRHTTLGALSVGDLVHVEADVIGKYVQRLASPHVAAVRE